jgi:hypothetical protein
MKLYQELASRIKAQENCKLTGNSLWYEKHGEVVSALVEELPHGSGIDGTNAIDSCTDSKLVLAGQYHALNENGYYDGWYDFRVVVKASLVHGVLVEVTGRFGKYQDVKDYLAEIFQYALTREVMVSWEGDKLLVDVQQQ